MRKTLLVAVVLGVGAPAAAQPAAACEVEIVTAPDDVRAQIQEWVRAEPRCAVKLTVRVIKTDGGLYVLATDSAGKNRERVVPDGLTAAVLVASWVADDGTQSVPPAAPPPAMPAPVAEPAPSHAPPAVAPAAPTESHTGGPPGLAPPASIAATPVADKPGRFIGAGFTAHGRGLGLRGELDIVRRWKLQLGVVAGWSYTEPSGLAQGMQIKDVLVMAQAAKTLPLWRRVSVRLAAGVGATITTVMPMDGSEGESMLTPLADLGATAGVRLSKRFELRLGGVVSFIPQEIQFVDQWGAGTVERGAIPQLFAGVGYTHF